jgi:hypothetical protein
MPAKKPREQDGPEAMWVNRAYVQGSRSVGTYLLDRRPTGRGYPPYLLCNNGRLYASDFDKKLVVNLPLMMWLICMRPPFAQQNIWNAGTFSDASSDDVSYYLYEVLSVWGHRLWSTIQGTRTKHPSPDFSTSNCMPTTWQCRAEVFYFSTTARLLPTQCVFVSIKRSSMHITCSLRFKLLLVLTMYLVLINYVSRHSTYI